MTPIYNEGVPNPLSRVTIGSMADLGYTVNVYGADSGLEFLVNSNDIYAVDDKGNPTAGVNNQSNDQSHSSVAMDADGDFTIAWTSYGQDGASSGLGAGYYGENGVYAKRYSSSGSATSFSFLVNQTVAGNQQDACVAMDANGNFIISWESNSNGSSSYDIYARRYASTTASKYQTDYSPNYPFWPIATNPLYGPNGEIGSEFRVNSTTIGDQRYASSSMDDTGDAVVVWTYNGDVYYQRYAKTTDNAGPTVGDVSAIENGVAVPLHDGDTFNDTLNVTQLIVSLSENVSVASGSVGATSILNPANWTLTKDGVVLSNAVVGVTFGFNSTSGRYEAVLTIDTDPTTPGNQVLAGGKYVLTLSDNVTDLFGNKLDGNNDGTPGGNYFLTFNVKSSDLTVIELQGVSSAKVSDPIVNLQILNHNVAELVVTFNEAVSANVTNLANWQCDLRRQFVLQQDRHGAIRTERSLTSWDSDSRQRPSTRRCSPWTATRSPRATKRWGTEPTRSRSAAS